MPNSSNAHFVKVAAETSLVSSIAQLDPSIAGRALVEGLEYLKARLNWSGTKVAHVLHLAPNTLNTWLKKEIIPLNNSILSPDIQAIIHLLAIHRSLEAMFDDPSHQQAWLTTFHPYLKAVPESLMSQSMDGLIYIRHYLDYIRGRGA